MAGWFKAFGEQGFTLLFRERAGKRHIGGIKKMRSYHNYSTIDIKEKEAAKEKNKRYILYRLPAYKGTKRGRYGWKCVDKNSWEYWVYYCSDGYPGKWPATGPALIGLFMIRITYMLILEILSRLKEYFSPLAAKFNKKLLQGVQGDGFLEKSPMKHLAAGGKNNKEKNMATKKKNEGKGARSRDFNELYENAELAERSELERGQSKNKHAKSFFFLLHDVYN